MSSQILSTNRQLVPASVPATHAHDRSTAGCSCPVRRRFFLFLSTLLFLPHRPEIRPRRLVVKAVPGTPVIHYTNTSIALESVPAKAATPLDLPPEKLPSIKIAPASRPAWSRCRADIHCGRRRGQFSTLSFYLCHFFASPLICLLAPRCVPTAVSFPPPGLQMC